jgi:hypothetical protein
MFLDNEATLVAVRSSSAWQARAICLLDKHRQHTLGARACLEANRRLRQQERRSQHAERASCDSRRETRGCWPHRVPDKRAGCFAVRPTLQTCMTMCYPGVFRGDGDNHGNLSAGKRRNDSGQTDK